MGRVWDGGGVSGNGNADLPVKLDSLDGTVIGVDLAAGLGTVLLPDGRYTTQKIGPPRTDLPIVQTCHVIGRPLLVATTDRGEHITLELPTVDEASPLDDRRVVYLDQQAWSKLALARHEPAKLPAPELDAARWLIDLAENGAVVLPFSGGRMTETAHWSNHEGRRNLGLTIATLSRGWQMLDTLAIRAREFEHVLAREPERWPIPTVWTLAPNAVFSERGAARTITDLPPDLALTTDATAAVLGLFSAVLGDSIPRTDSPGWAEKWSLLANDLVASAPAKEQVARIVNHAIIVDAAKELATAANVVALTPDAFGAWLADRPERHLARLPAVGLASEVMFLKIRNGGAKWTSNDLVDIFDLVQAAGYADAVVGERAFVYLIREAQRRLGRQQTAFRTLAALRADF